MGKTNPFYISYFLLSWNSFVRDSFLRVRPSTLQWHHCLIHIICTRLLVMSSLDANDLFPEDFPSTVCSSFWLQMLTCTFIFRLSLLGDLSFYLILLRPVCEFGVGNFWLVGVLVFFLNEKEITSPSIISFKNLKPFPAEGKIAAYWRYARRKIFFICTFPPVCLFVVLQFAMARQTFLTVGFPVACQDEMTTCSIQGCWCRGEQHHRGFGERGAWFVLRRDRQEGGWVVGGNDDSTAGCQSLLEMSDCLGRCQVGARTTERQVEPGALRGARGAWFLVGWVGWAARVWMVPYSNQTVQMCSGAFGHPVPSLDDVLGALKWLHSRSPRGDPATAKAKKLWSGRSGSGGKILWLKPNGQSVDLQIMEINTSVTDQVFDMCKCQQPSAEGLRVRVGLILPVQLHLGSVQTPLSGHVWHISTHHLAVASITCVYRPLSAMAMSFLQFSTCFQQHGVLKACSLGAALLFFPGAESKRKRVCCGWNSQAV